MYIVVLVYDSEGGIMCLERKSLGGLSMVILELYQGDYQKDLVF